MSGGLPNGWALTNFDSVLSSMTNGLNGKQNKDTIGIPVSRIETISNQHVDLNRIGFIEEYDSQKIEKYLLKYGDILFSHINSSIHLGKTAIIPEGVELYHGVNLLRLTLNEAMNERLFNYYCKYIRAKGEFSARAQHAVNQSSLNQKNLKTFEILVPPLNEQIRIANKLDSLLAKVDAAQTRLEKIPTLLKRFRQSVLAAATSGELTIGWREENIVPPWEVEKVGDLVEKIEAGKSIKCNERPPKDHEHGIIKISAVTWGVYDESESKTLFSKDLFLENRRVEVGDFLISRANTIELLGMPVIVHATTKNLMLSDKVLRLVMAENEKKWLNFYLRSPLGRSEIELRATGNQKSMRNIGQKALLAIPIPSLDPIEKSEIVRRVESLFALADNVEKQYTEAQKRTDRLTQSLLAKAFRGELVPQDPNDEPASELLKRIQVEREQQAANKPKRKTSAGKARTKATASGKAHLTSQQKVQKKDSIREKYASVIDDACNNLKGSSFSIEQFRSVSGFSSDYETLKALILNLLNGIAEESEPLLIIDSWDDKTGDYRLRVKDIK